MIFIDGERWPPEFHGTGSEEIFGGGACPNVAYTGPYSGFQIAANPNFAGKTSMYRFFVNDPVRFSKSIKVTFEHGAANNLANDYSSTAFWYQSEPHKPFPPLPPRDERRARVGDDPYAIPQIQVVLLAEYLGDKEIEGSTACCSGRPETCERFAATAVK